MRRFSKRSYRIIVGILLFVILAIIIPIFDVGNEVGDFIFKSENGVSLENTETESIVQRLLASKSSADLIAEENNELRQQLQFFSNRPHDKVVAYVLFRDPFNHNLITLTTGSADGVSIGDPVIVGDGIIVGKIIKVTSTKSVAELLTSEYSKLLVKVSDRISTEGVVSGSFGSSLVMSLIPSTSEIKPDDIIVTSGLEDRVPAGLVVGIVEQISDNSGDVFKEASLIAAASYQRQEIVSVLLQKSE